MKPKNRDSRAIAATGEGAESAGKALRRQTQSKPGPAEMPTQSERKQAPAPKPERKH